GRDDQLGELELLCGERAFDGLSLSGSLLHKSVIIKPAFSAALFPSFAGVRIAPGAKLDRHRRADELELVPEVALEVALVGVGYAVEGDRKSTRLNSSH